MELKKVKDFDSKERFELYMLEVFIAAALCEKPVEELHDLDIAKAKRKMKMQGVRLTCV